jgi:hypothetical protein
MGRLLSFNCAWGNALFAADPRYSDDVRQEGLDAAYYASAMVRERMPRDAVNILASLTESCLPIVSLVHPFDDPEMTPQRAALYELAIGVGRNVAYDAIRHLADLGILDAGGRVLWTVLRYAHLNSLPDLQDKALSEFSRLASEAERVGNDDAVQWLRFLQADAIALLGDPLPHLPKDVESRVRQARAT